MEIDSLELIHGRLDRRSQSASTVLGMMISTNTVVTSNRTKWRWTGCDCSQNRVRYSNAHWWIIREFYPCPKSMIAVGWDPKVYKTPSPPSCPALKIYSSNAIISRKSTGLHFLTPDPFRRPSLLVTMVTWWGISVYTTAPNSFDLPCLQKKYSTTLTVYYSQVQLSYVSYMGPTSLVIMISYVEEITRDPFDSSCRRQLVRSTGESEQSCWFDDPRGAVQGRSWRGRTQEEVQGTFRFCGKVWLWAVPENQKRER